MATSLCGNTDLSAVTSRQSSVIPVEIVRKHVATGRTGLRPFRDP